MKRFFRDRIFSGWSQPNWLTYLLLPLTGIFRVLSWLRIRLYKAKILGQYQAKVPVVVVGNISVGGTGKTPLTIALAEHLVQCGLNPGVISRGYGGSALEWPQRVNQDSNPHYFGDEPVLIARRNICPVVVGPDRGKAIDLLLRENNCDVILSDDGLQHYAMRRDIEISVVDAQRRHLNLFCLPAGPLREPVSRLNSVDMVMLHMSKQSAFFESDEHQEVLSKMKLSNTHSGGSSSSVESSKSFIMHLEHKAVKALLSDATLSSGTVHAVAGIGHPQRFFNALRDIGFDVIEHPFADHHQFAANDFKFGDKFPIVMTEKDAVKCSALANNSFYYLPVEAKLNDVALNLFDSLVDSAVSKYK